MARVSKKAPAKKVKAPQARTKTKQARTVKLAAGGAPKSKSRVNEAGNYTKPGMRKDNSTALRLAVRAAHPDNGRREKPRCWHQLIRKQGAVTSNHDSRFSPVRLCWDRG